VSTLFPYTTLFRSRRRGRPCREVVPAVLAEQRAAGRQLAAVRAGHRTALGLTALRARSRVRSRVRRGGRGRPRGGDRRAAHVAVVRGLARVALRAGDGHARRTRVVLGDAVARPTSSSLAAFRRSRTVPSASLSAATSLRSRDVASSLPVSAASCTARPSFTVAVETGNDEATSR